MTSGYRILWSERAIHDLEKIIDYLLSNWTEKEAQNFVRKLDARIELIEVNPKLFPRTSKRKNIHRSILTRHTVIYYKASNDTIKIVTLFDPRQLPGKMKI